MRRRDCGDRRRRFESSVIQRCGKSPRLGLTSCCDLFRPAIPEELGPTAFLTVQALKRGVKKRDRTNLGGRSRSSPTRLADSRCTAIPRLFRRCSRKYRRMSDNDDEDTDFDTRMGDEYLRTWRPWEPREAAEWIVYDPLALALQRQDLLYIDKERGATALHAAWMRLPPMLRDRIRREREIAATLVDFAPELRKIVPEAFAIGVGAHAGRNGVKLMAVVNCEQGPSVDELEELTELWDKHSRIPTRVESPESNQDAPVQIDLKIAPQPVVYGRQLPVGSHLYSDPDPAPPSAPVLQSGDAVGSESPVSGVRDFGTLTCIVSDPGSNIPMLLGSGHVFEVGGVGGKVISGRSGLTYVGTVRTIDSKADAAVAALVAPYVCDCRLRVSDLVPAAPVIASVNLPVQMHGPVSGRQTGYINQTNVVPISLKKNVKLTPMFTADIACAPGDSGALLATGLDKRPPFSKKQLVQMSRAYVECMTCAMLGMLKAGPPSGADPLQRPQGYFAPIFDVLDALRVEPWVR